MNWLYYLLIKKHTLKCSTQLTKIVIWWIQGIHYCRLYVTFANKNITNIFVNRLYNSILFHNRKELYVGNRLYMEGYPEQKPKSVKYKFSSNWNRQNIDDILVNPEHIILISSSTPNSLVTNCKKFATTIWINLF